MTLDAYRHFLRLLWLSLLFGRVDLAVEFASAGMVVVAEETEAAGLYYGPRYPNGMPVPQTTDDPHADFHQRSDLPMGSSLCEQCKVRQS